MCGRDQWVFVHSKANLSAKDLPLKNTTNRQALGRPTTCWCSYIASSNPTTGSFAISSRYSSKSRSVSTSSHLKVFSTKKITRRCVLALCPARKAATAADGMRSRSSSR